MCAQSLMYEDDRDTPASTMKVFCIACLVFKSNFFEIPFYFFIRLALAFFYSAVIKSSVVPWACPVLGWGTTGEAHVLYSFDIDS
jgi:hypothetical protein